MAWDKTKPAGTTPVKDSDDAIRANWAYIEERLEEVMAFLAATGLLLEGSARLTYDTSANRPTPGNQGKLFISSDTMRLAVDDGSAWQDVELPLTIASQAQGDIIYYNGTEWVRLAAGTSGFFLKTQGAGANPAWVTRGAGKVLQVVNTQTGADATGTTVMPNDDTIPQSAEGVEFMTRTITPNNASNLLYIEVVIVLASSASSGFWSVALFQDATGAALASIMDSSGTANNPITLVLRHKMTAGTASSTTFKIRAGNNKVGTTTLNGFGGNRKHGGVMASSITITEIEA